MDVGIDPTISSTAPALATAQHWSVEEVAEFQELLGRAGPVENGNGYDADHATMGHATNGLQTAVATADRTPTLRDVSGRYRGGSGVVGLELRVDVDGVRPMRRISGDFFRTMGGTTTYVGSFIVHTPVIQVNATQVRIDGVGVFSMPISAPRVRVVIPRTAPMLPAAQATVQFMTTNGVIGATFACAFTSPHFRRVEFEQDFVDGVTPFAQYDTSLLPSGGPSRVLSISSAFAEAGIEMVDTGGSGAIPGSGAGANSAWSNAELHASMVSHFSVWRNEPGWKVWALAATIHEDGPSLRGIMFDQAGKQRQGCAAFHSVIGGTTPFIQRAMLRTYVHEIGHCFNLFHSFHKEFMTPPQPNRLDALSWMHYPDGFRSPGGNGAAAYWAAFPFQFDDPEIIHLRHGFRDNLIMGGQNFGMGAADINPGIFQDPVEDRSGFTLELRGPTRLRLGEAVVVEAKLTPHDRRGVLANTHLHPNLGYVQIGIVQPSGRTVRYRPLMQSCADPQLEMLDESRPAAYDSAYIGYGYDGFYFDQIGRYQIRAIYHAPDGSRVYSNVLRLSVRAPMTPEEDEIAELYLGDDQGKLLYLLGSDSDELKSGNDAFQRVLDQYGGHPMAVYANMALGMNAARSFKTVREDGSLDVRKADFKASEQFLTKVVASSSSFDPTTAEYGARFTPAAGVDNVTLSMVFEKLAEVRAHLGDIDRAEGVVGEMDKLLADRQAPAYVRERLAETMLGKVASLTDGRGGKSSTKRKA